MTDEDLIARLRAGNTLMRLAAGRIELYRTKAERAQKRVEEAEEESEEILERLYRVAEMLTATIAELNRANWRVDGAKRVVARLTAWKAGHVKARAMRERLIRKLRRKLRKLEASQ